MTTEAVLEEEPGEIYTAYFHTVQELTEALTAADTLGLGVRVESYTVTSEEDPDSATTEFKFTLLAEQPDRTEAAEEA
ncbi:hypothetical protein ACIA8K_14190 [Catenuloplanes sp. NPDC051500]|uniref:hypothetical protein n=1 Tax=Catenuloplanes sp. NPDC051500 TaxID=3363959 RepID=UPI0037A1FE8B